MRANTLALLALVTVIALGGAIMLPDNGGQTAPEPKLTPAPVLPTLDGADAVTIRTNTATVELARKGDAWGVAQKDGYNADQAKVADLLRHLAALQSVEAKTADPKLYKRLDVGGPDATGRNADGQSTLVSLAKGKAVLGAVILGKTHSDPVSGSDDGVYVRRPADAGSFLARPALQVSAQPLDWIDTSLVDLDPVSLTGIALNPGGLSFVKDDKTSAWHVVGIPAGAKLKAQDPGADVANLLHPLRFTDVEQASKLTGAADATIVVQTKDGLVVTLSLFKRDKPWVAVKATGSGAAAAKAAALSARVAGWAYRLDDDSAKVLSETPADLVAAPPAPAPATPAASAPPAK